ncbi:hypothetical protein MPTK1_6g18450 [Marchantia polymorpha subsp. ruderalis]|uniref:Uncharacterized protein n=2 Tax=Marchantia polymorpha TaxID=3197 RepID=A0AAF6BTE3_MARPO|nr:hypothetical protein MARPO_0038s0055 [Marchantia polymorpha]BBN15277.1 hypothetical protein Mp_6g18450 [Marchantia polymorpha subsp. ruderalis]|eukprot:PTQ40710.1 hypothetical protein MARPO_0038s0055 [Marchantia polymorpha]
MLLLRTRAKDQLSCQTEICAISILFRILCQATCTTFFYLADTSCIQILSISPPSVRSLED